MWCGQKSQFNISKECLMNSSKNYAQIRHCQFTMFDIASMSQSKYIEIIINFGHAGGGIHGSYRRYRAFANAYQGLQVLEDTENINYGGGNGFSIYKPDNSTVRVDWLRCSNFADSYHLYCEIKTNSPNVYITNHDSAFA